MPTYHDDFWVDALYAYLTADALYKLSGLMLRGGMRNSVHHSFVHPADRGLHSTAAVLCKCKTVVTFRAVGGPSEVPSVKLSSLLRSHGNNRVGGILRCRPDRPCIPEWAGYMSSVPESGPMQPPRPSQAPRIRPPLQSSYNIWLKSCVEYSNINLYNLYVPSVHTFFINNS